MVEPIINDPTQELGYVLQRTGLLATGKQLAEAAGYFFEVLSPEIANTIGVAAGALKGVGGLITIGLAAGVSSALTQMDYLHRRDNLASLYKDELAAKLGKPAGQVKASDLDTVAKENHTIKEELSRSTKQRNYGFGLSFIASMSALAVIKLALPAALAAMSVTLPPVGMILASAVLGVTTYNLIKAPLHALADKLFGIDDPTTNDHIVAIARARKAGKTISREQVLSVFVAANPELDKHITAEYGQHFDALSPQTQHKIAAEINTILPLDKLTLDINSNKMNVTELAFAAVGQSSGVEGHYSGPEHKKGILSELYKGMVDVVPPSVTEPLQEKMEHLIAEPAHIMAMMHAPEEPQQMAEQPSKESFVTRLALAKKDPHIGHVQQVEQPSNDTSASLNLPS